MKLKWLLNNSRLIVSALGAVALAAGCSSENTGGSSAPAYSESAAGGTAETTETTTSAQTSGQTSGSQTIPLYKEQVNVGSQQVNDGTVTIKKIVKTETVNQPVTLQKQSLYIDRQPSSTGQQPGAQAFQDQQVSIQLHHDEPFVSTQVVPNGQVVATTKTDSQQTTIQKQVRTEDVAIDKGNAQNVVISGNINQQNQPMGAATEPGGQTSGAAAQPSAQASSSAMGPITDITTITACSDVTSLNGRQVQLVNVKVDQVAGQSLYISDNAGKDACVHLDQPAENIHPGDMVNISGTATDMSTMGHPAGPMPPAAAGQRVCINGQSVQVAK